MSGIAYWIGAAALTLTGVLYIDMERKGSPADRYWVAWIIGVVVGAPFPMALRDGRVPGVPLAMVWGLLLVAIISIFLVSREHQEETPTTDMGEPKYLTEAGGEPEWAEPAPGWDGVGSSGPDTEE